VLHEEPRRAINEILERDGRVLAKSGPQNSTNTTTFGTPQFRFLTGARDPRQIQLALKLSF